MKLADYLTEQKMTDAAFAEKIGRDRSFVARLRTGKARPSWPTIELITAASAGSVTANDFQASAADHPRTAPATEETAA